MSSWKLLLPPGSDTPRSIDYSGFNARAKRFNDNIANRGYDLRKDSLNKIHKHIISEEWEISGSTSFDSYGGGNTNHLARFVKEKARAGGVIEQVASIASGDSVISTILLAGSTDNLKISSEITYGYKCNAFFDVFVPAMVWKSLELPTMSSNGTLTPPGTSLSDLVKHYGEGFLKTGGSLFSNEEEVAKLSSMSLLGDTLYWGPLELRGMLLTKASPTFNKSVDENGYPTQAKVKIEFTTSSVATVQHIEGFLKRGIKMMKGGGP